MDRTKLINFLREEEKKQNLCFYCNDFEFADRLLELINSDSIGDVDTTKSNIDYNELIIELEGQLKHDEHVENNLMMTEFNGWEKHVLGNNRDTFKLSHKQTL